MSDIRKDLQEKLTLMRELLPQGALKRIASKLDVSYQTVLNAFISNTVKIDTLEAISREALEEIKAEKERLEKARTRINHTLQEAAEQI